MAVNWPWSTFWGALKAMPTEGRVNLGRELGGDDFVTWVHSRSPKVQIEILEEAPKPTQQFFYSQLSSFTTEALGIEPQVKLKTITIRDNRSKR